MPGEEPAEVASSFVGDRRGDLDDVTRSAAIALPPAPRLHRKAAAVGRFLDVAPVHALANER
jgi:hypothetical protein